MNMINKFGDFKNHGKIAAVKNDFWSDLRDSSLDSLGITQPIREAAQPAIDYGKNQILPKEEIKPAQPQNFSEWVSTKTKGVTISPTMAIGGVAILLVGYIIWKKA